MKKKRKCQILLLVTVSAVLMIAAYISIGLYFRDTFYPGTYVNGIYCTGKTVEAINTELEILYCEEHFAEGEVFILQDALGKEYKIQLEDVLFDIDYSGQLNSLKQNQNPLLWIKGLLGAGQYHVSPQISFSEDILKEEVATCGIRDNNRHTDADEAQVVEIRMDDGYVLFDGRENVLDNSLVEERVFEALSCGEIYAEVSDCYTDLAYTEEMLDTIA